MAFHPKAYLQSVEMDVLLRTSASSELQDTAYKVRERLLHKTESGRDYLNEHGLPRNPRFSLGIDVCLYMMVIEELAEKTSSELLSEIFRLSPLSCKMWIKRLREECACDIDLDHDRRYQVVSWGIYNRDVYVAFQPYVKLVVSNWLARNPQHLIKATRTAQKGGRG